MLPSGSWLHIAFGIAVGIVATFFVIMTAKSINEGKGLRKLVGSLVLYSLLVAFLPFFYATALSGGLLKEWQLLGRPDFSDDAEKIIDVGYVEGKSGKLYHFTCFTCSDGRWEQVEAVTKDEDVLSYGPGDKCGPTLSFLPFRKNSFIDFQETCMFFGVGTINAAYALDADGHVYSWTHGGGEYSGIEKLLFPINSVILSFGFGILMVLLLMSSSFVRKSNTQTDSVE